MNFLQAITNNQAYFEDFITRSTYHSNAIEGSTLSYAETYAVLWNDNNLKITAEPRELYGAINYKYALNLALKDLRSRLDALTEKLIKHIAVTLNKNVHEIDGYRQGMVIIRGAEHIPPDPQHVPQRMMQLVYDYNNHMEANVQEAHHLETAPEAEMDPFLREAKFHVAFERIHPFEDGNGRCGRILITRGLVESGVTPAVISSEKRAEYLRYLAERDSIWLAKLLREGSISEEARLHKFCS